MNIDTPAFTEWWPGGDQHVVYFLDNAFKNGPEFARGTAVHELAHIIDYNNLTSSALFYREALPRGSTVSWYASQLGINQQLEYWAEAVTQWVYPDWRRGQPQFQELKALQVAWLTRVLRGWGY